jgi:hypothetical protein
MILQTAVNKWAAKCPQTFACLNRLHNGGVRLAVFSSRPWLTWPPSLPANLTRVLSPKTPTYLRQKNFDLAAKILDTKPTVRELKIRTGDGLVLKMLVREIVFKSDSDIQLIQPLTPFATGRFNV